MIIPVCDCTTPLIWTTVFLGKEYWCPYCGKTWGHDEPKKVKNTLELQKRFKLYKEYSDAYLDAKSTQICSEMQLYGKWVKQDRLPKAFKVRAQKIIDGYKFKVMLGANNGMRN